MSELHFLESERGQLAFRRQAGRGPGLFWLGGFSSDMSGAKAEFVANLAAREGRAFLRFDYSGHGLSAGRFEDGTIGVWLDDAVFVFDTLTEGPQILIGSSMGGWIAALLALRRKARIAGLALIAPAPDFTETLILPQLSDADRARLSAEGRLELSLPNGGTTVFTRRLIEEARAHLLLGGPIDIACPTRILQGMKDDEVPYAHAVRFAERLGSRDVEVTLVKEGGHRLSEPVDLDRLARTISALCAVIGP